MKTTERQAEILKTIVRDYIDLAQPISSEFLEKKYKFGICPATIRIEMQKLAEAGFIFQPHTSAGRVPTDKGYRLFVDDLLEEELAKEIDLFDDWIEKEMTDSIKFLQTPEPQRRGENKVYFLQTITKKLSLVSSNLALGYLPDEKILWKDGWEEIIKEPEFGEKKLIDNFIEMIRDFEGGIEDLEINSSIKVYIGKENPFSKTKEFSTIITKCHFPEKESGILAILGPKRMDYNRNIGSLNSLLKFLATDLNYGRRK